jgi:hypothetical protein
MTTVAGLFLLILAGCAFQGNPGPTDAIAAAFFLIAGIYILTLRGKRF